MANETNFGSLPVASDSIKEEIFAAFARIEAVPCTGTLIDLVSKELWDDADEYGIEAGSADVEDVLDQVDEPARLIA